MLSQEEPAISNAPGRRLRPDFARRLAWTLLVLGGVALMGQVPLPGVDQAVVSQFSDLMSDTSQPLRNYLWRAVMGTSLSVAAIGLRYLPLAVAALLLARAALGRGGLGVDVAGGWTRVMLLSARLAIPCSLTMAALMLGALDNPLFRSVAPDAGSPGFWITNLAAIGAGTSLSILAAHLISRLGLGDGFLVVFSLIPGATAALSILSSSDLITTGSVRVEYCALLAVPLLLLVGAELAVVFASKSLEFVHPRGSALTLAGKIRVPWCPGSIWPVLAADLVADLLGRSAGFLGLQRTLAALEPGSSWRVALETALAAWLGALAVHAAWSPGRAAQDMVDAGAFFTGVRPGKKTEEFLRDSMRWQILAGVALLGVIRISEGLLASAWSYTFGGSGVQPARDILIVSAAVLTLVKSSMTDSRGGLPPEMALAVQSPHPAPSTLEEGARPDAT